MGCCCGGKCGCESKTNVVYSCSGASNAGQLSNDVAVAINDSGCASMGCLVGVAAGISTMVMNAKSADMVVMIDGCPQKCGSKVLENAGVSGFKSFVITEMGVKKTRNMKDDRDKADELKDKILKEIR